MRAPAWAVLLVALGVPAFAGSQYATPIPANALLVTDAKPPDRKYVGAGMVLVPDTSFIIILGKRGNIRPGPISGTADVKARSRKLAKGFSGGYLGVDLPAIASAALASAGVNAMPKKGGYSVKPYAYVQRCGDDEMYRVAAALDVTAPDARNAWHGRYVVHLATPIPYAQFLQPDDAQVSAFEAELRVAMELAARLVQRDKRGELPGTGRDVKLGSLNLIGTQSGGMGIDRPAKDLWLTNVRLIEERDGRVVIRMRAHPSTLIYGMHSLARGQVHTLSD